MSSQRGPTGPVDYDALNDYLDLHEHGTRKLVTSDQGFANIEKNMFTAARCCTCWNHRRPTSEANRDPYLEKFLDIGNGDGNTISQMKANRQYHEILADMTRTAKNCRCMARLPEDEGLKEKEWPFETTNVFFNDRNEDWRSKMLWKAKATAHGYKDPGRSDGWMYDDRRPNMSVGSCNDEFLWRCVFGQAGVPSVDPGCAPLNQLKSRFRIENDPSKIPIIVAIDVEKSLTTFQWTGDIPMIAKIPTQVGISSFDPLEAMDPNNHQIKKAKRFNEGFTKGSVIPPGDRGHIWRGCGLFQTDLHYAEVEAQYYAIENKIPGWAYHKKMFPDSGSFTFHHVRGHKMKRMKIAVLESLNSLRKSRAGKDQTRPLFIVTWDFRMEVGAFRFLGLWDFLPDGIHARNNQIKWVDLQQHRAVTERTARVQQPGQKRSLTNFLVDDLSLYERKELERWAHNAGMDAAFTLEGFIALYTIPRETIGGMRGWAESTDPLSPQGRKVQEDKAAQNVVTYDSIWLGHKPNFTYAEEKGSLPIQERLPIQGRRR